MTPSLILKNVAENQLHRTNFADIITGWTPTAAFNTSRFFHLIVVTELRQLAECLEEVDHGPGGEFGLLIAVEVATIGYQFQIGVGYSLVKVDRVFQRECVRPSLPLSRVSDKIFLPRRGPSGGLFAWASNICR